MAFFDTARSPDGLSRRSHSNIFAAAAARFAAWNDARITRKALSGLSDHELDDIGLCRGDIDGIAAGTHRP